MEDKQFINEKAVAYYGNNKTILSIVDSLESLADKVKKNDTDDLCLWIALTEIYLQQLMIMNKLDQKQIDDEVNFQLLRMNDRINWLE